MRKLLASALVLLPLLGCSGGDPEPVRGDNPAAANGKKIDQALSKEQIDRRANAPQPPSGPG